MKKSDLGLIVFNGLAAIMALIGLTSDDIEPLAIAAVLSLIALTISSAVLVRRSRQRDDLRAEPVRATTKDEMDVHAVLDFDARLEALERAQHDAVDAARWRALVESGQVTAPAASLDSPAGDARRQRVAG